MGAGRVRVGQVDDLLDPWKSTFLGSLSPCYILYFLNILMMFEL